MSRERVRRRYGQQRQKRSEDTRHGKVAGHGPKA